MKCCPYGTNIYFQYLPMTQMLLIHYYPSVIPIIISPTNTMNSKWDKI